MVSGRWVSHILAPGYPNLFFGAKSLCPTLMKSFCEGYDLNYLVTAQPSLSKWEVERFP